MGERERARVREGARGAEAVAWFVFVCCFFSVCIFLRGALSTGECLSVFGSVCVCAKFRFRFHFDGASCVYFRIFAIGKHKQNGA